MKAVRLLGRLIKWPRQPAEDDAPHIMRKGERREREPDWLEEFVCIVGGADGDARRRPRSKPTSARRIRSNRC
jgi:hypothetical protein